MDAYVYLKGLSAASLETIVDALRTDLALSDEERAKGGIRAVASVTGEYDAVLFVEGDTIEALGRVVLTRLRGTAGVPLTETYIALDVPPPTDPHCSPAAGGAAVPDAPKRRTPALAFEALMNVKTEAGWAEWVYWDLFCNLPGNPVGPGLQGERLTTGYWDILVELGANTATDLAAFILQVKRWPHVVDTAPAAMSLLVP